MTRDEFRYCSTCGWEGIDVETCPDCGADTDAGGILL